MSGFLQKKKIEVVSFCSFCLDGCKGFVLGIWHVGLVWLRLF